MGTIKAKISIERAKGIPGHMHDGELEWLAHQASIHSRIVEVGSWMGRSTRAMADNTTGDIWAVDTFDGGKGMAHDLVGKDSAWLFGEFIQNVGDCKNVLPVCKSSAEAWWYARGMGKTFDMVFLDGDHDYETVLDDISTWSGLLDVNGLLCGHDYADRCPGVKRAVEEFVPNFKLMEFPGPERSIWYRP